MSQEEGKVPQGQATGTDEADIASGDSASAQVPEVVAPSVPSRAAMPARITIKFQPVGSAPPLRKGRRTLLAPSTKTLKDVLDYFNSLLQQGASSGDAPPSAILYTRHISPPLDATIGTLALTFGRTSSKGTSLTLRYSLTPAYG
eukprot:m.24188 g.24188  ORF g.24188 m.24188 type:complete len:145 (-) comp8566_c0_seq1:181-615(-)